MALPTIPTLGVTTTVGASVRLQGASAEVLRHVADLNRAHEVELSPLDDGELHALIAGSFFARAIDDGAAFLIAFDQDAPYHSPNFAWFRQRYARFVYVDRLAVADCARGRGLARRLYAELLDAARVAGHRMVTCEVNVEPPNEPSDMLHASLGFEEVGTCTLRSGKMVRYLRRVI